VYPPDASPKAVSGRTSYYVTRLAFHSLPQVIPRNCTIYGFGPPETFLFPSSCSWQARHASGLTCFVIFALLRLAFAVPPRRSRLDDKICKLVGSFCKKHAVTATSHYLRCGIFNFQFTIFNQFLNSLIS